MRHRNPVRYHPSWCDCTACSRVLRIQAQRQQEPPWPVFFAVTCAMVAFVILLGAVCMALATAGR